MGFNEQITQLCDIYQQAPSLHEKGIHVMSCDEKTGIQALEQQITPMKPGQVERQDSSYERHGTQCLIANFEVATGKVITPTIGDRRTEGDFVNHIENTIKTDPNANWIFILDQLNTHRSKGLVNLVAQKCGIEEDLGIKGKSGVLKGMETRAEFLSNTEHRIQFIYTPKHCSWMDQIEIWFSTLSRRLLKRLSVKSTEELKSKINDFISYFNNTMAKVFRWTYKGKPLIA